MTPPRIQIEQAISGRRRLQFEYAGLLRIVEPQTYGVDRRHDRLLVAFQIGGASNSGEVRGWKTFREEGMTAIKILDETFGQPAPGYQRDDGLFASIISQL